jgi:hypothetical protein
MQKFYTYISDNTLLEVNIPNCCQFCGKELVVGKRSHSFNASYFTASCEHYLTYKDVYKNRLLSDDEVVENKIKQMTELQDVYVPYQFCPNELLDRKYPYIKLRIPRIFPHTNDLIKIGNVGNHNKESSNITMGGCYGVLNWEEIVKLALGVKAMDKVEQYKQYTVKSFSDRDEWYNEKGLLHNENGSAIKYADGPNHYYLDGVNYTYMQYNNKILQMRMDAKVKNTLDGKEAVIDGIKYKLTLVDKK